MTITEVPVLLTTTEELSSYSRPAGTTARSGTGAFVAGWGRSRRHGSLRASGQGTACNNDSEVMR